MRKRIQYIFPIKIKAVGKNIKQGREEGNFSEGNQDIKEAGKVKNIKHIYTEDILADINF